MILAAFVGGGKVGTRVPLNLGSRRFSRIERLFDTLSIACSQGKWRSPGDSPGLFSCTSIAIGEL
jgi:hypothetical protein